MLALAEDDGLSSRLGTPPRVPCAPPLPSSRGHPARPPGHRNLHRPAQLELELDSVPEVPLLPFTRQKGCRPPGRIGLAVRRFQDRVVEDAEAAEAAETTEGDVSGPAAVPEEGAKSSSEATDSESDPDLVTPKHSGTSTRCRRKRTLINRRAFRRGRREGDAREHFTWSNADELGSGAFGRVFRGSSRYDKRQVVAVKQVARGAINDVDELWAEIGILSELDHPNILRFLEAYEDRRHVFIVTEVCLGGDLCKWLPRVRGNIEFVARIAQEVTSALAHCHENGICHRDLKLDNIFLIRNAMDSPVRVADFGLAKRCSQRVLTKRLQWAQARSSPCCSSKVVISKGCTPKGCSPKGCTPKGLLRRNSVRRSSRSKQPQGVRITSVAGTPEYMAPEVIRVLHENISGDPAVVDMGEEQPAQRHFYDFRCDVWSLGVILYTLLVGRQPYALEQVTALVAEESPLPRLDEISPDWLGPKSDPRLWDFLCQCLNPVYSQRSSAQDLLDHAWLIETSGRSLPTPSSAAALAKHLRGYAALTEFKRAALLGAVQHLTSYEYEQLRASFQRVDTGNTGTLTAFELRAALEQVPPTPSRSPGWIEELAEELDADGSGDISYTEFLAAAMDHRIEDRRDLAWAAFCSFDVDGNGSLSKTELAHVLKSADAEELLALLGADEHGQVDFEGFIDLLRRG